MSSADPGEAIALFRYRVIAEAANPRFSPSERGLLVRELASNKVDPDQCRRDAEYGQEVNRLTQERDGKGRGEDWIAHRDWQRA